MSDDKLQNAMAIQMMLGNVALKSTSNLLSNEMIAEETTPFTLSDGTKFEITVRRL